MRRIISCLTVSILLSILSLDPASAGDHGKIVYPETPRIPVTDSYHGVDITDDYFWLEDAADPAVQKWTEEQEALTHSMIDNLPQKKFLVDRFNELWRYDDESVPEKALIGDRIFFWTKKKDQDKWVYNTKADENAEAVVLLDPNNWPEDETLGEVVFSRDGKYIAFGKAKGGDENPVFQVMEVETREILPDKLKGWRQGVSSWLPNNEGFLYSSQPLKGTVPEGEEEYWSSVYLHKLGTAAEEDEKIFWHDEVKEYWHYAHVTEDGKYMVFYRGKYYQYEVYFRELGSDGLLTAISSEMDAKYSVNFVEDKILIKTDKDAPLEQAYIADIAHPERENWKVFLPEHEKDKLSSVRPIAGHIYAAYKHNAYTKIYIYNLEGELLRELKLPAIGSASVSGYWSQPEVWVSFASFTYPTTTYKYDFGGDKLNVYKEFPVEIDVSNMTAEQVWYESKDGTPVSMFLIHRKDIKLDGSNPTYLNGYGGFNISMSPRFATTYVVWLEAGGMVAVANLRGGGEYGQEWHEAGMLEKKQNVFDDFIAAAEWLVNNNYTSVEKLAISGASNGGLLVGAVMVQRPELCKVVECGVPLLDMLKYHKYGYSNVWAEEYGSSDDPEGFSYIRAYSPYHNVVDGTDYPSILITGSENDARTDALHARKMTARLQAANPGGEPVLLLVRKSSGHHGGTTISIKIDQAAEEKAFIMDQLGMQAPEAARANSK